MLELERIPANVVPKYFLVKKILLEDIQKGKYQFNTKLPTETELMKKFNIARGTARQAIQELVREGVAQTIQGKGCFVSVSSIPKEKIDSFNSKRIVLIMSSVTSNYYSLILKGILDIVQAKGYNLEVNYTDGNYEKELRFLSKLINENISGLIFVPSFNNKSYKHLLQLQKKKVPIVLLSNYLENYNFDYVGNSNYDGAKKAINYLIKLGHRNIVFLGGGLHVQAINQRFEAYRDILKKNKIGIRKELILSDDKISYDSPEEEGYKRIKEFLSKNIKFTAIFAKNDQIAFGSYKALKEKGISVPDKISIIGYDDLLPSYSEIELTTVRQDVYRQGYYAAKLLFKRIDNKFNNKNRTNIIEKPEKIELETKLIVRGSTAKVSNI